LSTIKLGCRSGLKLNIMATKLLRNINIDKKASPKVYLEFIFMKINLRLYYGIFKNIYRAYSIIYKW